MMYFIWEFLVAKHMHTFPMKSKLKSKSIPCVFLRYYERTKAYRLICVETKRIIKSWDVGFLEGRKEVKGVHDNRPLSNNFQRK
jgi:hypothetical protein